MIGSFRTIRGSRVTCIGEEMAHVSDLLFDDSSWLLRFLVVFIGTAIEGKRVVVPIKDIGDIDWTNEEIQVSVPCGGLKKFPLFEDSVLEHKKRPEAMRWGRFWRGAGTFGVEGYPEPVSVNAREDLVEEYGRIRNGEAEEDLFEFQQMHLRSFNRVINCKIHGRDSDFGKLEDFVISGIGNESSGNERWKILSLLVNAKNWWISKLVSIEIREVEEISLERNEVVLRSPREKLFGARYEASHFSL